MMQTFKFTTINNKEDVITTTVYCRGRGFLPYPVSARVEVNGVFDLELSQNFVNEETFLTLSSERGDQIIKTGRSAKRSNYDNCLMITYNEYQALISLSDALRGVPNDGTVDMFERVFQRLRVFPDEYFGEAVLCLVVPEPFDRLEIFCVLCRDLGYLINRIPSTIEGSEAAIDVLLYICDALLKKTTPSLESVNNKHQLASLLLKRSKEDRNKVVDLTNAIGSVRFSPDDDDDGECLPPSPKKTKSNPINLVDPVVDLVTPEDTLEEVLARMDRSIHEIQSIINNHEGDQQDHEEELNIVLYNDNDGEEHSEGDISTQEQ